MEEKLESPPVEAMRDVPGNGNNSFVDSSLLLEVEQNSSRTSSPIAKEDRFIVNEVGKLL